MAGIGFALRELDRRDSIFGSIASIGHGAVVSAGPWIFTVLAIALIHRGTAGIIDPEMSYNFRGLVIYCFALSLLATAPVVNVAIRQIADDIYLEEFQNVRPRYVATLLVSCLISGVVAVAVHGGIFRLAPLDLLVEVVSTMVVGLIWPTLAFCGAVKDYKGITFGFIVGLLISIFGTIWAAAHGYNPAIMMLTFVSGLSSGVLLAGKPCPRELPTSVHQPVGASDPIGSRILAVPGTCYRFVCSDRRDLDGQMGDVVWANGCPASERPAERSHL